MASAKAANPKKAQTPMIGQPATPMKASQYGPP
jgi:hypothetical protein